MERETLYTLEIVYEDKETIRRWGIVGIYLNFTKRLLEYYYDGLSPVISVELSLEKKVISITLTEEK